MALDVSKPDQVKLFVNQQLQKGRKPEEIEAFLKPKVMESVKSGNLSGLDSLAIFHEPAPLNIRHEGFLGDLGRSFVEPAIKGVDIIGESVGQLGRLLFNPAFRKATFGGELTPKQAQEIQKKGPTTFSSQPELIEEISGNLGKGISEGFRGGAGIANLAAMFSPAAGLKSPAFGGKAVRSIAPQSTLNKILQTGARETLAGGLAAGSQEDSSVSSTLTGAAFGGATAAALTGFSPLVKSSLSKASPNLVKAGDALEESALIKTLGKPIKSEGGVDILKTFKNTDGLVVKSTGDLLDSSVRLLSEEGSVVRQVTEELSSRGVVVESADDVLKMLDNEISKAPAKSKRVLQRIRNDVASDIANSTDPQSFYTLKGQYGDFSNWNTFDPSNLKAEANVYGKVYNKMNDILDDTLKKNGFDEFRATNKKVHTALKAKNFAERQISKGNKLPGLAFRDILAGTAGVGAGGPVAGAGAIMARKVASSPKTQGMLAQILQRAGRAAPDVSQIPMPSGSQALARVLGPGVSIGAGGMLQNSQSPQPQAPPAQVPVGAGATKAQGQKPAGMSGIPQITDQILMLGRVMLDDDNYKKLETIAELQKGGGKGKAQAKEKALQATSQLRTLYGRGDASNVGTDKDLSLGGKGGVLARTKGSATGALKSVLDPEFDTDLQIFRNQATNVLGLFSQAFGSGTPQEGEAQRLIKSMPGPGTSDKAAKAWFDNMEDLFKDNPEFVSQFSL